MNENENDILALQWFDEETNEWRTQTLVSSEAEAWKSLLSLGVDISKSRWRIGHYTLSFPQFLGTGYKSNSKEPGIIKELKDNKML